MTSEKMQRLKEQRKALDAKIRQEQLRQSETNRKRDTRRKVLWGAMQTEWIAEDAEYREKAIARLERFLVRDADRALFDFPPLVRTKS